MGLLVFIKIKYISSISLTFGSSIFLPFHQVHLSFREILLWGITTEAQNMSTALDDSIEDVLGILCFRIWNSSPINSYKKIPSDYDVCITYNLIYWASNCFCTPILRPGVCASLLGRLQGWDNDCKWIRTGKEPFLGMMLPGCQGKLGSNKSIFTVRTS